MDTLATEFPGNADKRAQLAAYSAVAGTFNALPALFLLLSRTK